MTGSRPGAGKLLAPISPKARNKQRGSKKRVHWPESGGCFCVEIESYVDMSDQCADGGPAFLLGYSEVQLCSLVAAG